MPTANTNKIGMQHLLALFPSRHGCSHKHMSVLQHTICMYIPNNSSCGCQLHQARGTRLAQHTHDHQLLKSAVCAPGWSVTNQLPTPADLHSTYGTCAALHIAVLPFVPQARLLLMCLCGPQAGSLPTHVHWDKAHCVYHQVTVVTQLVTPPACHQTALPQAK